MFFTPKPLPFLTAFGIGVAWAFVLYCLLYRESRIAEVLKNPKIKWPLLVVDIILFLVCAGLVAALYAEPTTMKQAFTVGCAWQGLAGSLLAGTELQAFRKAARVRSKRARTKGETA